MVIHALFNKSRHPLSTAYVRIKSANLGRAAIFSSGLVMSSKKMSRWFLSFLLFFSSFAAAPLVTSLMRSSTELDMSPFWPGGYAPGGGAPNPGRGGNAPGWPGMLPGREEYRHWQVRRVVGCPGEGMRRQEGRPRVRQGVVHRMVIARLVV